MTGLGGSRERWGLWQTESHLKEMASTLCADRVCIQDCQRSGMFQRSQKPRCFFFFLTWTPILKCERLFQLNLWLLELIATLVSDLSSARLVRLWAL